MDIQNLRTHRYDIYSFKGPSVCSQVHYNAPKNTPIRLIRLPEHMRVFLGFVMMPQQKPNGQIIGPFSGRQLDFSLLVTRIGGDGAKAGKVNDLALDFFVYFCIFVGHI